MGRLTLLLCILCAGVLAANGEQKDDLFSFGGLDSLRDPECVPDTYRMPQRVDDIADECLRWVEERFDDMDSLNGELAIINDPRNTARDTGSSIRRFQLGIRDCMAEKMGVIDDSGEFVSERLEKEIATLGFPAPFERDVQLASSTCLRQTPANLSVEQRQNFYYVCRDSLLEGSCLYKRMTRDDPDRALEIGLKQTRCLDNLKPTAKITTAMDQCKVRHNVPIQYATLRRRRRSVDDDAVSAEGSGQAENMPNEAENDISVADRVNRFIYCVYETIGAVQPDGEFNVAPLIEEIKQFEGDEQAVKIQVDAATHCRDKGSVEEYNMCYYDNVSSGCHILKVQQAFLAGDPTLLPEY